MSIEDQVVLVNEKDEVVGIGDKLKIHRLGLLHRAFSVFIFNSHGDLLMQRRAMGKYHSPGLWSNTCCGHPRPAEPVITGAQRRLRAEMGLDCKLKSVGSFIYRADVGDGLIEHEFDHLLIGHCDLKPIPNPDEAQDWMWKDLVTLRSELGQRPDYFSCWLRIALNTELLPPLLYLSKDLKFQTASNSNPPMATKC